MVVVKTEITMNWAEFIKKLILLEFIWLKIGCFKCLLGNSVFNFAFKKGQNLLLWKRFGSRSQSSDLFIIYSDLIHFIIIIFLSLTVVPKLFSSIDPLEVQKKLHWPSTTNFDKMSSERERARKIFEAWFKNKSRSFKKQLQHTVRCSAHFNQRTTTMGNHCQRRVPYRSLL